MKISFIKNIFGITILIFGSCRCFSQGFVNLDFEDATIVQDTSSPYYPVAFYASDAIPGWSVIGSYLGQNDVLYNSASLGSTSVSILGTNGTPAALHGNFSVYLYGGDTAAAASISQTAVVPVTTESILFWSQNNGQPAGTLLVSLGGQNIPLFALSTGANRTILYGGNIPSDLTGESEQLMFSALEGINNAWNIDDIQFSSSSVPEPSEFVLGALGAFLLGFRRWQNSSK